MSKHRASSSTGAARFLVAALFFISILLILAYNTWAGIVVFLVSAAIEMRYVMEEESFGGSPDEIMEPLALRNRQL